MRMIGAIHKFFWIGNLRPRCPNFRAVSGVVRHFKFCRAEFVDVVISTQFFGWIFDRNWTDLVFITPAPRRRYGRVWSIGFHDQNHVFA
ncbi:hypothetical protein ACOSOMT5_P3025 [Acidiphilium sp. MT5]